MAWDIDAAVRPTAIEFTCPICHALPLEMCKGSVIHTERVDTALGWWDTTQRVSREAFQRAVDETGEV